MKEGHLLRIRKSVRQTIGKLIIFDYDDSFECYTLELPWKFNKKNISCIPTDEYIVKPYNSPTKGNVYLFENVIGRDMIEIHVGNKFDDILGCILVGNGFSDISKDGEMDIINSKATMDKFLKFMNNEILKLAIL